MCSISPTAFRAIKTKNDDGLFIITSAAASRYQTR